MKAWSILFLRVSVGLLLVLWGAIRLGSPEAGVHVSDKYYMGLMSMEALQRPIGAAEAVLGLLVVLGLFRRFVLPAAAVVLVVGAAAIWRYLADPLGLYLLDAESRQVLFFPSLAVAAASLVLMGFQDEDRMALDNAFRRSA
jgi:putative oxidoreductase